MRGKGEGAIYRVPADLSKPLKYWTGTIELPPRGGERQRVTIRRKDKKELLSAIAEEREALKNTGHLVTKSLTVEQWFTFWMNEIAPKNVRPKTAAGYRSVVFGHIIPEIGKVKLKKLTAAHIRQVHVRMVIDKELSSTYALNAHRIMAVAFEDAIREQRATFNPTKLTKAPRISTAKQEAFDVEEAIAVLEHVAGDPLLGARWATGLLTAARRGEVLGLERDRVGDELDLSWQLQRLKLTGKEGKPDVPADFEYRHLTGGLYLTRPKSSAGWRIIPLVDPLKSIIQRHLDSTPPNEFGLVFTVNDRPIDPDRDTKNWKLVLAETGIDRDVVLHGLRHTAIDLMYLAGVPEDIIMEIVGQSTRAVTRGYKSRGKVNRARLEEAMQLLSGLFTPRDDGDSGTPAISA